MLFGAFCYPFFQPPLKKWLVCGSGPNTPKNTSKKQKDSSEDFIVTINQIWYLINKGKKFSFYSQKWLTSIIVDVLSQYRSCDSLCPPKGGVWFFESAGPFFYLSIFNCVILMWLPLASNAILLHCNTITRIHN